MFLFEHYQKLLQRKFLTLKNSFELFFRVKPSQKSYLRKIEFLNLDHCIGINQKFFMFTLGDSDSIQGAEARNLSKEKHFQH
jgi:hypothetical protein